MDGVAEKRFSCHVIYWQCSYFDIGVVAVAANGGEYHLLSLATSRWSPADSHFGIGKSTVYSREKFYIRLKMT
jgi:hypothetical protein